METAKALEAVESLVGVYTGKSVAYGFDGKESHAWSETVTAANPVIAGDKAFVTVKDEMVFGGGKTYSLEWTEGYFIKPDGSPGRRYFDVNGVVTIENEIAPNTWAMLQPLSHSDIAEAPPGATGHHVLIKNTIRDGNTEKELLTRVTTLTWKDDQGRAQSKQFVSLTGYHQRTLSA